MKSFINSYKLFTALIFVFWIGCSQPETVVIDEDPKPTAPADTADNASVEEASFRNMIIGEYTPITSLDPLFVDNTAEMRAVQLLYEGLVRLDDTGSPVPGMAKSWEVGNDSLEYTFQLRTDVFYHDSNAFSTGTGRKMAAEDVKFIFERMARAGVPPTAAHMFMDIRGFDPYFSEQREVYHPSNRKLTGISGIQTPNDSTVVFKLVNQDSQFLEKLATPLAVVYPREAVDQPNESFAPVGTGPFEFSSQQSDSTLIFSDFEDYYAASEIQINRVDIVPIASESELFKAMSAGNIYLIPQLGPQLMKELINDDGELSSSYAERYTLQNSDGQIEYVLRYNPNANLTSDDANVISQLAADLTYFDQFYNGLVAAQPINDTTTTSSPDLPDQIFAVFSDDPFIKTYLGNLSETLRNQYDTQLQMMDIRAPSRDTGLLFTKSFPLIPDSQWNNYKELFRFEVQHLALQRSEIENLEFNSFPWWFDIRGVTLPAEENLN